MTIDTDMNQGRIFNKIENNKDMGTSKCYARNIY